MFGGNDINWIRQVSDTSLGESGVACLCLGGLTRVLLGVGGHGAAPVAGAGEAVVAVLLVPGVHGPRLLCTLHTGHPGHLTLGDVCSLLRGHDLHNTLGDVSMIASLDTGAGVAGLGLPCPPGHMCAHIKVSSYIAMYRCIKCPLLHCDHCLVTADCAGPRARVSSRRRATPPRSALPATRTTAPPPVPTTECRVSPIWTGVR